MRKAYSIKTNTRDIAVTAVLTALTAAATLLIKIPTLATEGYINAGDGIIMFSAVAFGPVVGFFVGGLGSCLADLISGYAHWVLPTFIIKGAEGVIVAGLFFLLKKTPLNRYISAVLSSIVGGGIMVAGYFFAAWIMKGSAAVAAVSAPLNCIQWLVGVALATALLFATEKAGVFNGLRITSRFSSKNKGVEQKESPEKDSLPKEEEDR